GSQAGVSTWKDLALVAVKWLGEHERLPPLPFQGRKGGGCYFLNSSPNHIRGPMRSGSVKELQVADQVVYIDAHRSARDLLACLCEAYRTVGVSPSDIYVNIQERRTGVPDG